MFKNNLRATFAIVVVAVMVSLGYAEAQDSNKIKVETVAENLDVPWQMVFVPDGRIFFTERGGDVRIIEDGKLLERPLEKIDVGFGEGGLLGIALDPDFAENNFVYLYYTYTDFVFTHNRVSRFVEDNHQLVEEKVLIDKIPGGVIHDGGRIKFGPDAKLYITTGEAGNPSISQDVESLGGKVLRINPDGTIPDDNPFGDSPVYSYGHRNPQGLDWDPKTGKLVITEHGPSGEKGFAHDEINVIKPGGNYGWPEVVGDHKGDKEFVNPILHTGQTTWAPSGATFYTSDNIPQWQNKFFVATLRGEHLRMLDLDLENGQVISSEPLFKNEFGRLRDATIGPDGDLYLLTSNKDGRGSPQENDDRILRIVAVPAEDKEYSAPLKQFSDGVEPQEVVCRENRQLVLKSSDESPVCVFPETVMKLVKRGWAEKVE